MKSEDLNIEELVEISELYDSSIFSFDSVNLIIKSESHFDQIMMFSNKAKKVNITIRKMIINDSKKEFEVNL